MQENEGSALAKGCRRHYSSLYSYRLDKWACILLCDGNETHVVMETIGQWHNDMTQAPQTFPLPNQ